MYSLAPGDDNSLMVILPTGVEGYVEWHTTAATELQAVEQVLAHTRRPWPLLRGLWAAVVARCARALDDVFGQGRPRLGVALRCPCCH